MCPHCQYALSFPLGYNPYYKQGHVLSRLCSPALMWCRSHRPHYYKFVHLCSLPSQVASASTLTEVYGYVQARLPPPTPPTPLFTPANDAPRSKYACRIELIFRMILRSPLLFSGSAAKEKPRRGRSQVIQDQDWSFFCLESLACTVFTLPLFSTFFYHTHNNARIQC